MIVYTYKNNSPSIRFTIDANTSIGPGEVKKSTVKLSSGLLEIIAQEEINPTSPISAIAAASNEFTVKSSIAYAVLTKTTILTGDAFALDGNGKIVVNEDCIATAIGSYMLNPSGTSGDANSICRLLIRRTRKSTDSIVTDYRGYIRYKANTGAATTQCLLELKRGDLVGVQASCSDERAGILSLSLIKHG